MNVQVFTTIIFLLLLVVIGTVLHRKFSRIPAALFQVLLGGVFGVLMPSLQFDFKPELFLLAVIAPILFFDGYHASRTAFWTYRWPILLMAFGLVFITVVGLGFTIHLLIPEMPMAVAFALAAVLSPTDAVAVKSITKGMSLPKGLMTILEGESLINDAAGIVSFKIALAAAMTGVFSIWEGSSNFLVVALGGALVGFIGALLIVQIRLLLRSFGFEDVYSLVSIQIITPFVIYLIAEAFHVSGILAVVTASIVYGIERDKLQQTSLQMQVVANNTWSIVGYLLNGFVFVLLGFLLPEVWTGLWQTHEYPFFFIVMLTFVIAMALFMIRFLWVYVLYPIFQGKKEVSLWFMEELNQEAASGGVQYRRGYYSLFAAVCGIHGTITLATALLIPDTMNDGSTFPLRDTFLFIAAGVVLISMIAATIFLPILGKSEVSSETKQRSMTVVHADMIQYMIEQMEKKAETDRWLLTQTVIAKLKRQLIYVEQGLAFNYSKKALDELRDFVHVQERVLVKSYVNKGKISKRLSRIYLAYRQKVDAYIRMNVIRRYWHNIKLSILQTKIQSGFNEKEKHVMNVVHELRSLEKEIQPQIMDMLSEHERASNRREMLLVKEEQQDRLRLFEQVKYVDEEVRDQLKAIHLEGIEYGRSFITREREVGAISVMEAHELRERLLYSEMIVIKEGEELDEK
nr:Na+/H+ antiporter [Geomicrobium sediminis]